MMLPMMNFEDIDVDTPYGDGDGPGTRLKIDTHSPSGCHGKCPATVAATAKMWRCDGH
jgi:hypothetical protein